MKKILILSDTHGRCGLMYEIIKLVKPIDRLVHCGDVGCSGIERELSTASDCPVHVVCGNNDYGSNYPYIDSFVMEGHRVIVTHGHRQRIYSDLTPLLYLAEENKADIVMFGHLHVPVVKTWEGITLVNPGSLTYPRQSNRLPSYIMITIEDNGDVRFAVRYAEVTGKGIQIRG